MSGLKGGQGRSEDDVYESAVVLTFLVVAAVASATTALVIWGLS